MDCCLYTHDGTKALIRYLHKASDYTILLRRFARIASYERSCFSRMTTQAHKKKVVLVRSNSTPHLMGYGPGRPVKTCGRPHGHGGRRISSSSSTPHLMGSDPGRPVARQNTWAASWAGRSGPYRAHISWAAVRPGPSNFERMRRGSARPIKFSEDGPRPGPAHEKFGRWAAARPSSSHSQIFTARPDPAHTNGP